jgi:predicted 3-demethylubiquinone-9 3-methyltransferase (glyoxalase superfamily)
MNIMQKIVPHLWFDKEAKEAATFYASIFPDSGVTNVTTLRDTPSGDCDVVSFKLWDQEFMAISAGPLFKFNPSVSFMVNFHPLLFESSSPPEKEAHEKMDMIWNELIEGGTVLMPLDKYPFSDRYGWLQDKYGLSWQLILSNPGDKLTPAITPSIMFVGEKYGKAEEAINHYLSVFKDSTIGEIHRYGKGQEPDKENAIMFADFILENKRFAAMDSAQEHKFDFNEAISFLVNCADQKEIDYYWQKLSAFPEAEQCGWMKDKYGVSWQITSAEMGQMMMNGTRDQVDRLVQSFLPMKKLDLAKIKKAFEGE